MDSKKISLSLPLQEPTASTVLLNRMKKKSPRGPNSMEFKIEVLEWAKTSSIPMLPDKPKYFETRETMMASMDDYELYGIEEQNEEEEEEPQKPQTDKSPKGLKDLNHKELCCGIILSILVGCCWTLVIHSIKRCLLISHLFPVERSPAEDLPSSSTADPYRVEDHPDIPYGNIYPHPNNKHLMLDYQKHLNYSPGDVTTPETTAIKPLELQRIYDAPFFTAWILTISTIAFYPIHQVTVRFCSCMGRKGPKSMSRAISDAVQGFRERGMTLFQFLGRCAVLCGLWLLTNYLIVYSLRILRATEVLALFATTTSFVYLLSWVVLHQQFVGLRILAVILSNMGIALFAYMDGQTHKSKTVGGVILGALAAGISAVFKVSLKKMFGVGATISQQVALIFSVMGIISLVFLWPIFLTLYFTGFEVIRWDYFPWDFIACAIFASL
ncbi:unnamed protein product, partial [Allacma fusca]